LISPEINPFLEACKNNKPLILDGAMGSLLHKQGFTADSNLWMTDINQYAPEVIRKLHQEYINAGADIITTNTFRTNPLAFERAKRTYDPMYLKLAVQLANEAISENRILLAGSNAPAEECYQKERNISYNKLEVNHKYHIDLLIDNQVDLILNETQSHYDEIKIISEYCATSKIPFIVSLYINNPEYILSGEKITDVVKYLWEHDPLAIGFNCIAPTIFSEFMRNYSSNHSWGFYLNCIDGNYEENYMNCRYNPEEYLSIVKKYLDYSPSFIGGCCGTTPEHIKIITEYFSG
jgi:homocysteine S-methyltransferase